MIMENYYDNKKSSIINEAIRGISGHFLQKDFTHKKAHKMQTNDFHSDDFICPESIKKQTSNFCSKIA